MKINKVILVDEGFNHLYKSFISNYVYSNYITDFITFKDYKKNKVEPDLILFTGGTDVNSSLYGQKLGKYTESPNKQRDLDETEIYNNFPFVPKLGICRGAQLLCVLNGGSLIQHVEGHMTSHNLSLNQNINVPIDHGNIRTMTVPSDHHQMMYPYILNENKYNIVAWATKYRSNTYLNGNNEEINLPEVFFEPEIVYFKNSNSLSIQFHPEYPTVKDITKKIIAKSINNILNSKK